MLAAGANAVAAVRSPKMSADLQSLQTKYPEALTIVAMDTSVFSSVKVRSAALASGINPALTGMCEGTPRVDSLRTLCRHYSGYAQRPSSPATCLPTAVPSAVHSWQPWRRKDMKHWTTRL